MNRSICIKVVPGLALVVLASMVWNCAPSYGQRFTRLRPAEADIISAVAYAGQPFGVGKVVFRAGRDSLVLETGGVRISEQNSRVHYPAFSEGLTRIFADSGIVEGGIHTVWFLFRGETPLDIVIDAESRIETRVNVVGNRPVLAQATQDMWWTQYNLQMRRQIDAGEYPAMAEVYLTSMLANRLNRRLLFSPLDSLRDQNQLQQTADLVFDAEQVRVQAIRQMMQGSSASRSKMRGPILQGISPPGIAGNRDQDQSSRVPLPAGPKWGDWPALRLDDGIEVEMLAHAVPEECFYLHFGTWDNQVWLNRLMDEHGSELARMVSMRGHQPTNETKIFDQLVLESSQIDEMFGGQLVADIAIIGRDFYFDDGPSIGVLFESKNGLFESNMHSRRNRFARSQGSQGITLEKLEVSGHEVTLLASPDNQVRSFYAVKDNFHLVTTSRAIVERFFEAVAGDRSLAFHTPFRYARAELPVSRQDTVFFYLSSRFLESILSPQYQIELSRRNRALASIQLLQMASWAADSEGINSKSIETLQSYGFLPPEFGVQPDGSTISVIDGVWQDSMRGRRGFFIPISDVEISWITHEESAWLGERIEFYQTELGMMNPIFGGLKRYELERPRGEKVERIVFDARVAPFGGRQWEKLEQFLGPPMQSEIAMDPNDLVAAQVSLRGFSLLPQRSAEPHQLFAAIQADVSPTPPPLKSSGFLQTVQVLKTIPGYLGAWPSPGYLDTLPALGGRPDEYGFTYSRLLDLWRMQHGEFSVLAFDRRRLENLRPSLAVVPSERPAQFRLRVGDIAHSNLRGWINSFYYQQGWESSLANVRFIHMLSQQFGIPIDSSLAAAEEILDVKLICPLKGSYELIQTDSQRHLWRSSSWPSFGDPQIPVGFQAPPLSWFRGMSLDVYQRDSQFVVHGFIDIERQVTSGLGSMLPSFNLFKGFDTIEKLPAALPENATEAGDQTGIDETELKPPRSRSRPSRKKTDDG